MREIKFRAWDNKAKSWAKWEDNFIGQDGRLHIKDNDDIILEQFTGLLDSKGREIYEGDIVLIDGHEVTIEWKVTSGSGGGGPEMSTHTNAGFGLGWYGNYDNVFSHCEVIGNIHESE